MQNFGSSDDMASIGRAIVEAINEVRAAVTALGVTLGANIGTGLFTTPAATTLVVNDTRVTANSVITIEPNGPGSAATQAGAAMVFADPSTFVPGVSFTVQAANGAAMTAAQGFRYIIVNPLS